MSELKNLLEKRLTQTQKGWIDSTWEKLEKKWSVASKTAYDMLPYTTQNGKFINSSSPHVWTNGFWPGIMWLMYVSTGKEEYRKTAEHGEQLLDAALCEPWNLFHDVGFMWLLSAGVNYRLFKKDRSKARVMFAAEHLASRYNHRGGFLRPGNTPGEEGRVIIDTMMNLPLLYMASGIVQDKRFDYVAINHADRIIQSHLRADGSVRHVVEFDPENGDIKGYLKGQGYSEDSAWARGNSWALYGFTLSYIHTGKKEYLDAAKRVAHYFICAIADDGYIPRVDLRAPALEHDTTAGAIAASGLIELAKQVDELEKHIYFNAALKILKSLDETYCDWTNEEESVLQHGVGAYFPDEIRLGKPIIYGDFFFTEAIYKLRGNEFLFW